MNVVGDGIFSLVREYKHNDLLVKRIEIFGKGLSYVIDQYQDGDEIKFFDATNLLFVSNSNYAVLVNKSHILLIDIGYGHGHGHRLVHGRVVHRVKIPRNNVSIQIVGPNDFNICTDVLCYIKTSVVCV